MLDRLPQLIDPIAFADKQRDLVGTLSLTKFTRLADTLLDTSGAVSVDLAFGKEERLSVIRGHIKANLSLTCRTCLEAVAFAIAIEVNLAVVQTIEQADRLSGKHEPLMLEDEKISLHELIEDEILLALPSYPRHQYECNPHEHLNRVVIQPEPEPPPSNNPFSVLAQLKNSGD